MTQLWRPKSTSWCSFCSMTCWGYWATWLLGFKRNLLSCFVSRPPVLRHRATQLWGYGSGAPAVFLALMSLASSRAQEVAENVWGKAYFICFPWGRWQTACLLPLKPWKDLDRLFRLLSFRQGSCWKKKIGNPKLGMANVWCKIRCRYTYV